MVAISYEEHKTVLLMLYIFSIQYVHGVLMLAMSSRFPEIQSDAKNLTVDMEMRTMLV